MTSIRRSAVGLAELVRQLLSVAAAEIRDREQFVLLDKQMPFDNVLHAAERARASESYSVDPRTREMLRSLVATSFKPSTARP